MESAFPLERSMCGGPWVPRRRRLIAAVWSALLASIVCAAPPASAQEERPRDAGREWVRSHPITISSLVLVDNGFEQYKDLGMTLALIWKGRDEVFEQSVDQGLPWHYKALPNLKKSRGGYEADIGDDFKNTAAAFYEKYPGGAGFVIWDEPRRPAFPIMAEVMGSFKETFPEALIYSNLYSAGAPDGKYYDSRDADGNYVDPPVKYGHDEYIQEYLDLCKPDVLSTDIYPFVQYETCDDATYIHTRYFATLENIRKHALNAGIPYWTFVQAYEYTDHYLPSESDARMQVFSSLAYGFTGISYFIYFAPHYGDGVLDADENPSPVGEAIRTINAEIQVLGGPLRFLTSTDVRYVPGQHYDYESATHLDNPLPVGTRAFDPAAAAPYRIQDIQVNGISAGRNAMVGFFEDDAGERYFMLVNLRRARGVSSEDMSMGITVRFDDSVETIHRLSRTSGQVEELPIADGALEVILPGGTGDLFKIDNAAFPGSINSSSP